MAITTAQKRNLNRMNRAAQDISLGDMLEGFKVIVPFHLPGTAGANILYTFVAPENLILTHVQAVGTNAHDATITVGTVADPDGYLTVKDVGDSSVPGEWSAANFTGALVPVSGQEVPVADGTVVRVVVDFDGAAGTAVQNLSVALTFRKG